MRNEQNIKNVTVIGEISKHLPLKNDKIISFIICNTVFLDYKGILMQEHYKPFKNKTEAIEAATKYMNYSKEFADGTKPFCIVFYHKGKGWVSCTSNKCNNASFIQSKED